MNNKIRLEFPSLSENIALSRLVVASLAGQTDFTLSEIEELKVAVSEAVTNSIVHGYSGQPTGLIVLEVVQKQAELTITIQDFGRGIADLTLALQPAFSTEPGRMGLGFTFMKSFMDDVAVNSELNQGTTVRLQKIAVAHKGKLNCSAN